MSRIIGRLSAVLGVALLLGACGAKDDQFSIGNGSGTTSPTATTTASSNTNPGLTAEEVQAMIDKSIASYDKKIKGWVADGFVSEDELEALIDEELPKLIDQAGFLDQGDIDEIVAKLKEAGVGDDAIVKIEDSLGPIDGPVQGIAGENPCKNREGGTFIDQMLLDLGRELKMADTIRPTGPHLETRRSFAGYVENDPEWQQYLVEVWNERVENEQWAFTLLEPARARVYWCPGLEADGTARSGVWKHQVTLPIGKVMFDFGNGVWVQKDCHNLTVYIWPPDEPTPPPPGVTTTTTAPPNTVPPTTTTPTTIPGVTTTTTTPSTTTPTTVVVTTTTLKPPVSTIAAPATTAAPAISTPPATSPVTLASTPPEVTDPEPVDTVVDATIPAEAPPTCIPGLPKGVPGACP